MSQKIVNIKYDPALVSRISPNDINKLTSDLYKAFGDEYKLIYTPFDIQVIDEDDAVLLETAEALIYKLAEHKNTECLLELVRILDQIQPSNAHADGVVIADNDSVNI